MVHVFVLLSGFCWVNGGWFLAHPHQQIMTHVHFFGNAKMSACTTHSYKKKTQHKVSDQKYTNCCCCCANE